jgi:two-component system response regulator RegX3
MRHLRTKLEDDPSTPRWLVTVRGIGYKFEP